MTYIKVQNSKNHDILVNVQNVNYITDNQIVFTNGSTLDCICDINVLLNTCNDIKEINYDPNRMATEKQLMFAKKISRRLNIEMPQDFKFNTVKKFLNDNVDKFRSMEKENIANITSVECDNQKKTYSKPTVCVCDEEPF